MPPKLPALATRSRKEPRVSQDLLRRFTWEIRSIDICLDDLRSYHANALGITGPQMMILMALTELEEEHGVPVNAVARLMRVESGFITKQSKELESKRFVRRKSDMNDARYVLLSLTDIARKSLASIARQQEELEQFVFDYLSIQEFAKLAACLSGLRSRLEKARLHAALDSETD
ncbi:MULTISPECIES: MarR family winged helix-turn-helix transcriptional regulator [Bradyrhizobium]|uniref:MarR family winged helix-turn-helix transcriptional regulator n=1 Tax=Bradyrhizobium TaxID=374 RepID=UPI0010093BE2|nr:MULTISPECIES: MarR family transcriptional regulator [Bradyrhizobium]MDA9435430.1 MarR family transcriptional regulator [Bradyrhizobium sp. CCBAU 51627]RXH26038.1 MarR family transcriptional regulator [Bradyrhizobium nanningense]